MFPTASRLLAGATSVAGRLGSDLTRASGPDGRFAPRTSSFSLSYGRGRGISSLRSDEGENPRHPAPKEDPSKPGNALFSSFFFSMSYDRPVEVCGSLGLCGALSDYRFDYSRRDCRGQLAGNLCPRSRSTRFGWTRSTCSPDRLESAAKNHRQISLPHPRHSPYRVTAAVLQKFASLAGMRIRTF